MRDEAGESRWDHDAFTWRNPNRNDSCIEGGQDGPAGWGLFCEKPQEIERGILQPGQWTDDTSMATHPKSYASYGEGGQFDRDAHSIRIPIHTWFT